MSYRNDANFRSNYQSDCKLFQKEIATTPTNQEKSSSSSNMKQQLRYCFKFLAFVFSHIGLGFLVLAYTIFGAFLFKHFEEPSVLQRNILIANIRNDTVNRLWIETYKLNVLYKENWTAMATKEIEHFQRVLVGAFKDGYWPLQLDSNNGDNETTDGIYSRWSFIDSWMYSISIITTIGYANRPLTNEGKLTTMLYALFGIPIMLLFLSTIGSLLGRGLKFLYNFCCVCSNDSTHSTTSFVNLDSSHDQLQHLHHDNYQVHHIAMNNISGSNNDNSGPPLITNATCNMAGLIENNLTCNKKNYTALNTIHTSSPYPFGGSDNRGCSCELDNNEAKMTLVEPIDHRFRSFTPANEHSHNCNCANDPETSSIPFYKDDYLKIHHSSSNVFASNDNVHCHENVPFYFCFFLIILYILAGSIMFHLWEGLSFLDGAYFCFVTLSTIGFGDILPEKTISLNQAESKKRIIIIVLYILGGMTLVAMSFNIIYEQLVFKFKKIGYRIQRQNEMKDNHHHHHHHHADHHESGDIIQSNVNLGNDSKILSNKFQSNEDIDV